MSDKPLAKEEHEWRPHDADSQHCPTYFDGCHCTVEALAHNIERADKAERELREINYGRERVHNSFRFIDVATGQANFDIDGCHCPYCMRDFDALAEYAADMELKLYRELQKPGQVLKALGGEEEVR